MHILNVLPFFIILALPHPSHAQFESTQKAWFCRNSEAVEPCTNTPNSVDRFNNERVFPVLQKLLQKDFFKFYKVCFYIGCDNYRLFKLQVNMDRPCPLWPDERECSSKECGIEHCDDEVPAALRNPAVQMVRFVSAVANNSTHSGANNKTAREVVLTPSHSSPKASHTTCSLPQSPSQTHSTCTSFKQVEDDQVETKDPPCNTGNQFDPIDTSLSEGDKSQLEDMEIFEDNSDRFCDTEGSL